MAQSQQKVTAQTPTTGSIDLEEDMLDSNKSKGLGKSSKMKDNGIINGMEMNKPANVQQLFIERAQPEIS